MGNSIEVALQAAGSSIFSEVTVDPIFLEPWMGCRLVQLRMSVLLSTVSVQNAFTSEFMAEVASSERKDVKLEGSVVSAQEQSSPVTMLNAFPYDQHIKN